MATLAELTAMRDALVAARASGRASVTYGDQSVTYKSDADMARALEDLERRIAATSGRNPVSTVVLRPQTGW